MEGEKILVHLENLVKLCPVSDDQDSVLDALKYCKAIIEKTGAFSEISIHNFGGVYSLTASTKPGQHSKVLLQAHIDVVPFPPTLRYQTKENFVYGRGVFDMLFAPACYLAFIEEQTDKLSNLDFSIMLTGDEELGGINGVNALLINGYTADVCILPDAGYGFGDLNVSAKGVYQFNLIADGKAHHGSRPWEGDGAANKLVLMLNELINNFDHSNHENSTITVARLFAGDADNKGPSRAKARIDIRYKDKIELQKIQQIVDETTATYGGFIDNVHIGDDYQLDINNQYVQDFVKLYEKHLTHTVNIIKSPGSSDARYFDAHNIPVIELRPDGDGAHSDEERLNIDSLVQFYNLLSEYILETAKI